MKNIRIVGYSIPYIKSIELEQILNKPYNTISKSLKFIHKTGHICELCGATATRFYNRGDGLGWVFAGKKISREGEIKQFYLTVDHIIPKSKGGSNILYNYQVLCNYCNNNIKCAKNEGDATKIYFITDVKHDLISLADKRYRDDVRELIMRYTNACRKLELCHTNLVFLTEYSFNKLKELIIFKYNSTNRQPNIKFKHSIVDKSKIEKMLDFELTNGFTKF